MNRFDVCIECASCFSNASSRSRGGGPTVLDIEDEALVLQLADVAVDALGFPQPELDGQASAAKAAKDK